METVPDMTNFWQAISDNNWPLVVAIALTFLVYLIRNISKDKIPKKYLPYLTLGIAVVSSVSTRMTQYISEGMTWWHGLIQGFMEGLIIGLTAMGFWSSGIKNIFNKKENKDSDKN